MNTDNKNNTLKCYLDKLKSELNKEALPKSEELELWNKIDQKNNAYERRKKLRLVFISVAVAASIILLCIWQWNRVDEAFPERGIDYAEAFKPATPEELYSSNVRLLLSDNQKIDIDNNESRIDYQEKGGVRINEETLNLEKEKLQDLNQLIVPVGKRASLTLSDGTKMWINSGSQVIFPAEFKGNRREIFVEGEIFLDVIHKDNLPFVVKTKAMDVTVLGTQFNVSTLEGKNSSEVVLVSGKVEVITKSNSKNIMAPGYLFAYDLSTNKTSLERVDVSDHITWKEGYYQFNKQQMDKVLRKIARYYGIQIEWEQEVTPLTCSGKLDLKDDPKEIFNLLKQAAPIEVEKVNETFLVKVKHKKNTVMGP